MNNPDAIACPGCGKPIPRPAHLDEPGGWLTKDAWCTECGGEANRLSLPLIWGPRWYAQIAVAFDNISMMPLVLSPEQLESMYEQAHSGAEACVMEPESDSPEAIEAEAARRTALAVAILAYGERFIVPPRDKPRRKMVEIVKEAYFHDPTIDDVTYGQLMQEADEQDQRNEWAAEAAPMREE